jgi:hypothetical protein
MANYCIRWHGIFKGLSQDGGRANLYKKTAAPLPVIKILISAGSISLDGTFKKGRRDGREREYLGRCSHYFAVVCGISTSSQLALFFPYMYPSLSISSLYVAGNACMPFVKADGREG